MRVVKTPRLFLNHYYILQSFRLSRLLNNILSQHTSYNPLLYIYIRTGAHGKKLPVKAKRAPSKRKKAPSKKKFLLGDILLGGVYKSKFLGKKPPVFFFFFLCWEAFYWEQKAPSKTPPSTLGGLNIFFRPPSKKKP